LKKFTTVRHNQLPVIKIHLNQQHPHAIKTVGGWWLAELRSNKK
jgi:hypothetical protein